MAGCHLPAHGRYRALEPAGDAAALVPESLGIVNGVISGPPLGPQVLADIINAAVA